MPHINTEPGEHDHTVSAYIVHLDKGEPRILMHKHKKMGMLMCFGGHIEKNETPWQSVLHEVPEETGYDIKQLYIMQPVNRLAHMRGAITHPVGIYHATFTYNPLPGHSHTDTGYLFVTREDPNGKPAEGEVADNVWMTEDEVLALEPDIETFANVIDVTSYIFELLRAGEWEKIPAEDIEVF